ncbi:MAG: hypothetical protein KDA98_05530 [Acidimicrobiales bacterium]|nr:hypothetical protein [Acidimicrobiales bacterium]
MTGARRPLEPGRVRTIATESLHGVVVEVDATEDEGALAVLQAGLHDLPEGQRLIHGYDVAPAGLGAWVGDRRLRIRIWPAVIDEHGEITAEEPDHPDSDVLVIDLDPSAHRAELEFLADSGRLFVAGPEAGPTPLVVDLDRDLLREVLAEL